MTFFMSEPFTQNAELFSAQSLTRTFNANDCEESGDCPEGNKCVKGDCVAGCETDNDCPSWQDCVDGACREESVGAFNEAVKENRAKNHDETPAVEDTQWSPYFWLLPLGMLGLAVGGSYYYSNLNHTW